ncbi:MAG TPA: SMC-Scp complex subunit ScpB [Thermoplasmata archaeon]|nr:SMC-Scp complex subunit ScpB [Thermoplasmata archaeon]
MTEKGLVEAALYSSGSALTVEAIARTTGLDETKVKDLLRKLAKDYDARDSALEVAQIGTKWAMQIRSEYAGPARTFAPPEIDRDVLKTAALIAYHQPLLQSDLFDMIGSKVYEHTQALESLGLISRKPSGRSLALTTTRFFAEFFGIKATDREGIRRLMAKKAGVPFKEKPPEGAPDGSADAATDTPPAAVELAPPARVAETAVTDPPA